MQGIAVTTTLVAAIAIRYIVTKQNIDKCPASRQLQKKNKITEKQTINYNTNLQLQKKNNKLGGGGGGGAGRAQCPDWAC